MNASLHRIKVQDWASFSHDESDYTNSGADFKQVHADERELLKTIRKVNALQTRGYECPEKIGSVTRQVKKWSRCRSCLSKFDLRQQNFVTWRGVRFYWLANYMIFNHYLWSLCGVALASLSVCYGFTA